MFSFFKKKKKVQPVRSEAELQEARKIREEKDAQELANLLEGEESYKIFSWGFGFHDDRLLRDSFLPLKDWEPIEEVFTLIEKEYDNIEEGSFTLMIKDSVPSCDGDEIASLRIEIKYGYMYPLLKERVEKANPLDNLKWTEYWGGEFSDEVESLEFDQREISLYNLSKDVTLMKKFFKTFYETGTLPEEYME